MIELGIRLKNAIKNSKFSQKEIAKLINSTEKTLSTYTQGKAPITVETLVKICNIINVPIQEIIYGIDNNDFDNMILNKLKKLSDEQKRIVLSNIEFLENSNIQMSSSSVNIKDLKTSTDKTG